MPLTGNGRENNGREDWEGDARHFRPNAVEKRTLRRFRCHSTLFAKYASTLCFENFRKSPSQIISQEFFFLFPSYENLI